MWLFIVLLVKYKIRKWVKWMFNVRLAVWEMGVHSAVAGNVFDGVILCCPFSHMMSWMRSGTELSS